MLLPIGDDNTSRRTTPVVTYLLVLLNVAVFLLEISRGDAFILRWAFVPSHFLADPIGQAPTLFTAMFLHASWLHIGGNMLYLWIFGDNVEDRFGHITFALFYLVCGLAAAFAQLAFSMGSGVPTLGASGAISGVLAAYVLLFPLSRVRVLLGFFLVQLPALIVIGLWIVLQFITGFGSITTTAQSGGVAYGAHIGGFLAGLILAALLRGRRPALQRR
jgi:membrane associated rhomboid family serine protease